MRKPLLLLLAVSAFQFVFAQENGVKYEYKKKPAVGFAFTFHDFQTAADLKSTSLNQVLKDKQWYKTGRMSPGLALSYFQGLTNHLDFMARLGGTFISYPVPDKPQTGSDKLLAELDANINAKLLSDKYWVSPYLTAGIGGSQWNGYWGAYVPLGVGLQINLLDQAYININAQYRAAVTSSTAANHLFYSFGVAGSLFEKKEPKVIPPPPPPPDTDNDGIVDSLDACPTVAGLAQFNGCPDSDGDGIPDKDDKCPDVKGLQKYNGCPIPDTDGDGINDEEDKCPNQPGVAKYNGCPIPDTDGDGVNDEEDRCPALPGPVSNQGCPEIKEEVMKRIDVAAKNVFFATGSSKLLAKSNASLNEVVKILQEDANLKLDIEGHTDNTGNADKNQVLSEQRAKSVLDYLISKGVDPSRLVSAGFGQDQPVADNKTAAGRAQNRRVDLKLHYH
ncbi:MAG: OmpA family protein [Chitinophagaceae bacterium]|nr:OmpA family protein [Chitinophagaceae bacterium]MCW5926309.1 OmpA family protein [Chitinophagaceae bacterium]